MRGCLITVLVLVVLVLGMILPRFVIGDGVGLYEGNYRKLAQQALLETDVFFAGEPTSQLLITAKRVMKVGTCTAYPPGDSPPYYFQGEVQLYTIFGIPYGELRFQCEGTEIIGCPQNTAECTQAGGATVDVPGVQSWGRRKNLARSRSAPRP